VKRKDDYVTQAERDAWQMGYNVFERPAAKVRGIHPRATELLGELMQTQPEALRDAITSGWLAAMKDTFGQEAAGGRLTA
jgi:hypothetical protein